MMPKETNRKTCFCGVPTVTQAMRARELLARAAIRADVIQANSSGQKRGCAYSVSFPCAQEKIARSILREAGIRCQRGSHDLF